MNKVIMERAHELAKKILIVETNIDSLAAQGPLAFDIL